VGGDRGDGRTDRHFLPTKALLKTPPLPSLRSLWSAGIKKTIVFYVYKQRNFDFSYSFEIFNLFFVVFICLQFLIHEQVFAKGMSATQDGWLARWNVTENEVRSVLTNQMRCFPHTHSELWRLSSLFLNSKWMDWKHLFHIFFSLTLSNLTEERPFTLCHSSFDNKSIGKNLCKCLI